VNSGIAYGRSKPPWLSFSFCAPFTAHHSGGLPLEFVEVFPQVSEEIQRGVVGGDAQDAQDAAVALRRVHQTETDQYITRCRPLLKVDLEVLKRLVDVGDVFV
jgi:hypothetical protein